MCPRRSLGVSALVAVVVVGLAPLGCGDGPCAKACTMQLTCAAEKSGLAATDKPEDMARICRRTCSQAAEAERKVMERDAACAEKSSDCAAFAACVKAR
ncbi:MAG: hypothetical protein HY908_11765 [Myxococcales bacterium]|nr:hypothetical protein [Myxococcales bacterium]